MGTNADNPYTYIIETILDSIVTTQADELVAKWAMHAVRCLEHLDTLSAWLCLEVLECTLENHSAPVASQKAWRDVRQMVFKHVKF